jgi:hypothetical protein
MIGATAGSFVGRVASINHYFAVCALRFPEGRWLMQAALLTTRMDSRPSVMTSFQRERTIPSRCNQGRADFTRMKYAH